MRRPLIVLCAQRRVLASLAVAGLVAALAPMVPAEAALRVAVISDLNGAYGSTRYETPVREAVAALVDLQPDLVLSTGDMVAGQRRHPLLDESQLDAMWSAFHAVVTDPLRAAGITLAVTPGNHDASAYASFALERAVFGRQWRKRGDRLQMVAGEHYPFHYAFAVEDVLFISLDVTRVGALPAAQKDWLERLLEEQAEHYRYRVVFGHLPIYPFTQGRETDVTADHELEQILHAHGVQLYLSGHHHAFYPGYHDGIRHISQACLGSAPRRLIGERNRSTRAVTWLEFDDGDIRITGRTGRNLQQIIDIRLLPEAVQSRFGMLVRDDLRPVPPNRAPRAASVSR